jgi:hypothetical protein
MTTDELDILKEHGPYTLSKEGCILDVRGVALADFRCGDPTADEVEWDRAVVAALNEVCALPKG